jgi:Flp pilus assembly protein TadD
LYQLSDNYNHGGRQTVSARELQHPVARQARKSYTKGRALLEKGNTSEAIPLLLKATILDPSFAGAHNDLAVAYLHEVQPVQAIEHLKAALESDPKLPEGYSNLAIAYMQTHDLVAAESAARQMLNVENGSTRAHLFLGMTLLFENKLTQEAIDQLTGAETEFPQASLMLGCVFVARGDIEMARSKLSNYLSSGSTWGREVGEQWLQVLDGALKTPRVPPSDFSLGIHN